MFPKLRGLMDADQRAALGNEVLVAFEELMQSLQDKANATHAS